MAETVMLALEKRYQNGRLGLDLDDGFLDLIRQMADKHGFAVQVKGGG